MRNPLLVVVGAVVALLGVVFTLQGVGLLKGSTMTNDTTWAVLGPIIALAGLGLVARGRRRAPSDS